MKMCAQIFTKNEAGQILTYNSKNISLTKQKIDPERTKSECENHF